MGGLAEQKLDRLPIFFSCSCKMIIDYRKTALPPRGLPDYSQVQKHISF